MGSFISYHGNRTISDGKKDLFAKQMCRILDLGGMMDISEVKMFGYTITLLKPIREMKGNEIGFYYNYFGDRPWESAGFDVDKCHLWSGKVGDEEFSDVMSAAYMLYEIYDPEYGFAEKDCNFVRVDTTIGWLNHILGTQYSIGKRANIWECIEWDTDPEYGERDTLFKLKELIPYYYRKAVGGTALADLLYIDGGTSHLSEENTEEETYPADVLRCKRALEKYFEAIAENSLDELWALLRKPYKDRSNETRNGIESIAQLSLRMPARVFAYLAAELQGLGFWKIWKSMSAETYHDEQMRAYASKELTAWREKILHAPVKKVKTSTYLRQDGVFAFYENPEELKGKPNFYLSDADRLYWWDGTDEVEIAEETDSWLKKLAQEYRDFLQTDEKPSESSISLKDFMMLLDEINSYYWRIFPFESMFYDFAEHISQKEYVAAVELIRKVADDPENREAGKIIERKKNGGFHNKNVIENAGRVQMKRVLDVMANKKLRKKYFDF